MQLGIKSGAIVEVTSSAMQTRSLPRSFALNVKSGRIFALHAQKKKQLLTGITGWNFGKFLHFYVDEAI